MNASGNPDKLFGQAHWQIFGLVNKTLRQNDHRWCRLFWLVPASDSPLLPLQAPKVGVYVELLFDNNLHISYFIQKTPLVDLAVDGLILSQADFLWQENCLEFFVGYDGAGDYFELNIAPDGRYNIYHFDDYRTPNVMPPRPAKPSNISVYISDDYDILDGFYTRHISLIGNKTPSHLNPTVILYADGTPIFYAPQHANPPDFHNRHHWQKTQLARGG